MTAKFQKLLKEKKVLLADGATGTNLFDRGLANGDAPELWNVGSSEQIKKVVSLHRDFVDAGSDIILTNTFGANYSRLTLHATQNQVSEINYMAVKHAQDAIRFADRDVVVAGSIGPTGEIFEPLGPLSMADGCKIFTEQAMALTSAGADCLWIETMSSKEELQAAITATLELQIPVVTTCSFDTHGKTMMGISPADFHNMFHKKVEALGINCGTGAEEALQALRQMRAVSTDFDSLVIKANCGVPVFEGSKAVYKGTPASMAAYAALAAAIGAKIIGGCCGTTPAHVRGMREALDLYLDSKIPEAIPKTRIRNRRRD